MADKLPNVEDLEELPDFEDLEELDASKYSQAESGIGGLVTGATIGARDEIAGGLEVVGQAMGIEGLGASDFSEMGLTSPKALDMLTGKEKLLEIYRKRRDLDRLRQAEEREANPGTYLTAEIGGGLATPGGKVLKGFSEGLGLGKAATAGLTGASFGGAASLGTSEADLTKGEVGQAAIDTVSGTLSGGVLGAGMSKTGSWAGNKLKSFKARKSGEKAILNAVKPPTDIRRDELLGVGKGVFGDDTATTKDFKGVAKVLSETFVDENGKSVPIMSVGTTPETVLDNVKRALKQQWEDIQPVFVKAQQRINEALPRLRENADKAAGSSRGGVGFLGELSNLVADQTKHIGKVHKERSLVFEKWAYDLLGENHGDIESFNLFQLNAFKQRLGEELSSKNFSSSDVLSNSKKEFIKKTYFLVKEEIESLAQHASKPGENLGKKIKAMNARYSNLIDAKKVAENDYTRTPGQITGREFILPSIIGGLTASTIVGVGAFLGIKVVEKSTGRPIGRVMDLATGKGLIKLANMANKMDGPKSKAFSSAVKKIGNLPVAKRGTAIGILLKNNPDVFAVHEPSKEDSYKTAEGASNIATSNPDEINDLIRRVEESDSQSEKRFLETLKKAAGADKNKRQSLMFKLSDDLAFREMLEKYKKKDEE